MTYAQLLLWQQEARQPLMIQSFIGDYCFIFTQLKLIGQLLSQTLTQS
ncbi:MAG: hypothetical protein SVR94_04090 [Pseudomonadota bacterium]|nr:hypothetical protein [Pseudomonadota bacterium]